jgi:hypothetical protein
MAEVKLHPIQTTCCHKGGCLPTAVTMRAYEVYCHVYAPQEAMVTGWCRGGFSQGEVIAFMYAYPFPREEWDRRVSEAMRGMKFGERYTPPAPPKETPDAR